MTETNGAIPARMREIIEDFNLVQGREKLEFLLEFAEAMPPLPDWLAEQRHDMDFVHECMTPVYIFAEEKDGRLTYYFDVPAESPTVRGYAALLSEGFHGATPEQVMATPDDFYRAMGLQEVLTGQRLNGITAILAHMKRLAAQRLNQNGP